MDEKTVAVVRQKHITTQIVEKYGPAAHCTRCNHGIGQHSHPCRARFEAIWSRELETARGAQAVGAKANVGEEAAAVAVGGEAAAAAAVEEDIPDIVIVEETPTPTTKENNNENKHVKIGGLRCFGDREPIIPKRGQLSKPLPVC